MIWNTVKKLNINTKNFVVQHLRCIIPSIIYAICSVIYPNFIGQIIDKGIAVGDINRVIIFSMLMIIVGLATVISEYIQNILYDKFYLGLSSEVKNRLFKNILKASNNFLSTAKAGELLTSLNSDINSIIMIITQSLPNIFTNILILVGASFYILYYYKFFGLFIIGIGFFYIIYQKKIGKRMQSASEKTRNAVGEEAAFSTESLSNLENIQMSGYVDSVYKKYKMYNENAKTKCKLHDIILYKSFSSSFLLDMFIMIFILAVGAFQVENGKLEVGILFSVILYSQKVISPMRMLARLYVEIKDIYPIIHKTNDLISNIWLEEETKKSVNKEIEQLKFENVFFSYCDKNILNNFNLDIKKNEIVGIVGSNGKGKTTLLRLLCKMCMPSKGEIIINNKYNILDMDIESLHRQVSFLTQNIYLGSGLLREVLNPLEKKISDKKIEELLTELNFDFGKFGNSLEFNISESANNISGGERQKIALVRLIIENKKWIILDEPTSAMDAKSEEIFCNFFKNYLNNKTALIITHRTEILKICTRIINFDEIGEKNEKFSKSENKI